MEQIKYDKKNESITARKPINKRERGPRQEVGSRWKKISEHREKYEKGKRKPLVAGIDSLIKKLK